MKIGVDYYPEQWDRSLWSRDAEQMFKIGVKIVRICDSAWSKIEPYDNVFDFEWLDEVVETFEHFGIEIMMCIPTNCPPLWLYKKHPEIIQVGADGKPVQTGVRSHRCINSPVFMAYANRMTEQLVRRYGHKQSVVAWQIDSELESYNCTCDVCREKFRTWLLDKYDSFEDIKSAIGTTAHSLEYSDISEIEPPTAYPTEWQNPA
ncbi:MAG: beta-galactosidase, partial [Ruminococcus sp.]|nr:beta-galactosidase [Ruminococcus sp.]